MSGLDKGITEIRARTIGKTLKGWRERADLTQKQVSEALGYATPQFVSNWERGMCFPPFDSLPTLARLFGVTSDKFIAMIESYEDQIRRRQRKTLIEIFKNRK